jgi:type II secretory pathway component PulJ
MKQNRRRKSPVLAGFTLLEVLVAFGILFSCLVLMASLFTRHLEILQRMERAMAARSLSHREIAREAVERRHSAKFPAGTAVERTVEPVELEIDPDRRVALDRVTARAAWSFRNREYTESSSAVLHRIKEPVGS